MSGIGGGGVTAGTGTGQISLSSGTVTVGTNNDKTGYTASTVSDKTGYSLTAGSYVIHASSNQRGTIIVNAATSNTGSISSVTTTRSLATYEGESGTNTVLPEVDSYLVLTNSTTLTVTRQTAGAGAQTISYQVEETF